MSIEAGQEPELVAMDSARWVSEDELWEMVATGHFKDAPSLAALALFGRHRSTVKEDVGQEGHSRAKRTAPATGTPRAWCCWTCLWPRHRGDWRGVGRGHGRSGGCAIDVVPCRSRR